MVPMRRMIVRHRGESNGSSGLDVDLADVLQALGSRAVRSEWSGTGLQYCSTDERDVSSLELAASGERVSGTALLADQSCILQVIHGEFRAFDAGALWVILSVVDGSWWEVVSDDPAVFAAIKAQFKVVDDPPTAV